MTDYNVGDLVKILPQYSGVTRLRCRQWNESYSTHNNFFYVGVVIQIVDALPRDVLILDASTGTTGWMLHDLIEKV